MEAPKTLDEFLASPPPRRNKRCWTCARPDVAAVIVDFLDRKAAGKLHVTLDQLREGDLGPDLGFKLARTSVYRHVTQCLQRDPKTGHPL